jgi:subtilisin family serine protease
MGVLIFKRQNLVAILAMLLSAEVTQASECGLLGAKPSEYLVRVKTDGLQIQANSRQNLKFLKTNGITHLETLSSNGHQPVELLPSQVIRLETESTELVYASDATQLEAIKQNPSVLSVEANCFRALSALPNDPLYFNQPWVQSSHIDLAWDITLGKSDIKVAITDSGVDYNHPDLIDNIWTNNAELAGTPGIDDDGNGCIDDIHGCDVADRDGNPMPGPSHSESHGTHVAGLVAAQSNNSIGVVGTAPHVTLVPVKVFKTGANYASVSDLLRGLYYSSYIGAKVVNCSWGGTGTASSAEKAAFTYLLSRGILPVVAAGNETQPAENSTPAGIDTVFTVGSHNSSYGISTFSNYGSLVDILAPGGDAYMNRSGSNEFIYSTVPVALGSYDDMRGTSMAAPIVAGVAALIYSINPQFSAEDVAKLLIDGSDNKGGYGILNARKAVELAQTRIPSQNQVSNLAPPPDINTDLAATQPAVSTKRSGGGGCSLGMHDQNHRESNIINPQISTTSSLPSSAFGLMLLLPVFIIRLFTYLKAKNPK